MTILDGKPPQTYIGVVRTWECDENAHLNLTFYIRAFQLASETLALTATGNNPGAATAQARHLRFHRELLVSQPFTVDSAVVVGGDYDGTIVHLMKSGGIVCATALDHPGYDTNALPRWNGPDELALAMPRGLVGIPHLPTTEPRDESPHQMAAQLGIVRSGDLDHANQLLMHEIFARCTLPSLHLLNNVGLSSEWKKTSGCTHVGVEVKITRHGSCKSGDALCSESWIGSIGRKTISLRHLVRNHADTPIASIEQVLVVTDSIARRAVFLPEFVRAAARG